MGTVLAIVAVMASVAGAIVVGLLKDEVRDWLPSATDRLIAAAARRTGPDLQERYEEEWASHAASYPGRLARLWFAIVCLASAGRLAPKPAKAMAPAPNKTNTIKLPSKLLMQMLKRQLEQRMFVQAELSKIVNVLLKIAGILREFVTNYPKTSLIISVLYLGSIFGASVIAVFYR